MEVILQQLINGLFLGSIYALLALGYTMVYGIIGLIDRLITMKHGTHLFHITVNSKSIMNSVHCFNIYNACEIRRV